MPTPKGLRCAADTAEVRPFWRRAAAYYGGLGLGIYLALVLAVFAFLRTIGYPVSILHVGLPPLWHKVGQARGWFFLHKSNQAFAQDRIPEGLLYLRNAYDLDPSNYVAGIALAKHLQAGQPARSDEVYQRLLRDHPQRRAGTAQEWFRALLARGSFDRIARLARGELLASSPGAAVWMRALLYSTRRLPSDTLLRELATSPAPALQSWRPVFATELLLREGRLREARDAITGPLPADQAAFHVYYRVSLLTEMGDTFAALDLLARHAALLDAEANVTLRLDALAAGRMKRPHQQVVDQLLAQPLSTGGLPGLKVLCAHLIRFPDPAVFDRLAEKVARENLPLDTESAGVWFSLFCAAGAVDDRTRLHELGFRLRNASQKPFMILSAVEAFFRGELAERRITTFLPVLPLPLEVTYALFERYPLPDAPAVWPKRP
ncbi:MAG: hypothetical protein HZC55_28610 [Verrucomicrobia bacterium]|nr:hypothetical protein [Verrucomicrobiota bacterium]